MKYCSNYASVLQKLVLFFHVNLKGNSTNSELSTYGSCVRSLPNIKISTSTLLRVLESNKTTTPEA